MSINCSVNPYKHRGQNKYAIVWSVDNSKHLYQISIGVNYTSMRHTCPFSFSSEYGIGIGSSFIQGYKNIFKHVCMYLSSTKRVIFRSCLQLPYTIEVLYDVWLTKQFYTATLACLWYNYTNAYVLLWI